MYKIVIQFILFCFLLPVSAQDKNAEKIYVGTFTSEGAEGIYLCQFDGSTGKISLVNTFKGLDNPSFLKISPNKKFLYVVTRAPVEVEPSGGYVNAYRIRQNGDLQFINKQVSHGAGPCHVDVSPDGKFVAIATYSGGTTSLYKINEDGSLQPAASTIINEGSGPNDSRQKAPHAHSIRFSQDGRQVFSADLGTDRLNIYDLKKGKLVPGRQQFARLAPGAGPRHFDFHPNGEAIYVINELNSTITAFKKSGKTWEELQTVSTVPRNFEGENYCADIHVSANGRFLYGSNRGHNSIAVYKINSRSQQIEWLTAVPTQGEWPRNFTLSPDGKFLLVANQHSNNIVVFRIDPDTGIPEVTKNELKLPAPVCLEFR